MKCLLLDEKHVFLLILLIFLNVLFVLEKFIFGMTFICFGYKRAVRDLNQLSLVPHTVQSFF